MGPPVSVGLGNLEIHAGNGQMDEKSLGIPTTSQNREYHSHEKDFQGILANGTMANIAQVLGEMVAVLQKM